MEEIIKVLENLIKDSTQIYRQGDTIEVNFERLYRWEDRVKQMIADHISEDESRKFKQKYSQIIMNDPRGNFKRHLTSKITFLQELKEDINDHPEFWCVKLKKIDKQQENKLNSFWDLLHPSIIDVSKKLFDDKHYTQCVFEAMKEVNARVKKIVKTTTGKEYDGADLMNRAFSLTNPIIVLNNLSTQTGKDIQVGYMQIFAGSMTGIRNPKAHDQINIDEKRAIHFLHLASLLMFKIDESKV